MFLRRLNVTGSENRKSSLKEYHEVRSFRIVYGLHGLWRCRRNRDLRRMENRENVCCALRGLIEEMISSFCFACLRKMVLITMLFRVELNQ